MNRRQSQNAELEQPVKHSRIIEAARSGESPDEENSLELVISEFDKEKMSLLQQLQDLKDAIRKAESREEELSHFGEEIAAFESLVSESEVKASSILERENTLQATVEELEMKISTELVNELRVKNDQLQEIKKRFHDLEETNQKSTSREEELSRENSEVREASSILEGENILQATVEEVDERIEDIIRLS
jgi:chromosome segregation ATPase